MSRKPLLILGNSVSPETAACLQQSDLFQNINANTRKYQSDEPYVEIFCGGDISNQDKAEILNDAKAFVVQSTAEPVSDNIQHLLEMIHTLKSSGVAEVTTIIPFAALSRQDRHFDGRFTSVAADLLAKQLKAAGTDKVVTFTMHSQAAVQSYQNTFGSNFTNMTTTDIFASALKEHISSNESCVVCGAPDGAEKTRDEGQKRARDLVTALLDQFNEKAMFKIAKQHIGKSSSETKVIAFEGDVQGKHCVVIDDIIDGGTTMLNAARQLKQRGAKSVTCCLTHPILTTSIRRTALEKMMTVKEGESHAIDRLIMTDSIPEAADKVRAFAGQNPGLAEKIQIISLGPAILTEIKRQMNRRTTLPVLKPLS